MAQMLAGSLVGAFAGKVTKSELEREDALDAVRTDAGQMLFLGEESAFAKRGSRTVVLVVVRTTILRCATTDLARQ